MIKFRGRISFPTLDVEKYTQALEDSVEAQVRQGAREWLRAVIPKVPVYTGMSRGSLQPLGRFLKVAVPISPVAVRKGKNAEAGATLGGFKFERRGHRFIFIATVDVPHFIYNNFYEAPNPPFHLKEPTPWRAIEAGDAAFKEYVKSELRRKIPKIKNFLRYKTAITLG